MAMFSSRDSSEHPWRVGDEVVVHRFDDSELTLVVRDRPQHNPTNPILTEFRKLHEATGNDLWSDAYLSWSDLIEDEWTTEDEYFHAFKVLGRIVAIGK